MNYPRRPRRRLPQSPMKSLKALPLGCIAAFAIVIFLAIVAYSSILVVPNGKLAILIRKTGKDLPNGVIIAPSTEYKGIQRDALAEGFYILNPYTELAEIHDAIHIPEGSMGIVTRLYGDELPPDQILATEENQRGILAKALAPGTYKINPYAERIDLTPAFRVNHGCLGVVINMSGKLAANPNAFVVQPGERGVQSKTLSEGVYYKNPYAETVIPIDIQKHKFEMTGDQAVTCVSKDGFRISVTGNILWQIINPTISSTPGVTIPKGERNRVAEVFVKYVDTRDVITCIVEKVILPNARSLCRIEGAKRLARDFIEGQTREQFQKRFQEDMKKNCLKQGILIHDVLIAGAVIPDKILKPVQNAQEAQQDRVMYEQQKERQMQQKLLSEELKRQDREQKITKATADVSVNLTNARREQNVAVIAAQERLAVAMKRYEAARNDAEAILVRGQADSAIIMFQNIAEAKWLEVARDAFGSGDGYARFLFLQKLAPSIESILSNTDGPFTKIMQEMSGMNGATEPPPPVVPNAELEDESDGPGSESEGESR